MPTVSLAFKRVFNDAHNQLQNIVLPLGAPSSSEPPSYPNMPSKQGPPVGGLQSIKRICSSDYGTFIQSTFREEVKIFLEHFKHVILLPLSWWLTIWHFIAALTWQLLVSARILSPRGLVINRIRVRLYRSEPPSVSMNATSD